MTKSAASRWRRALGEWAIPQEILDQAPESPWIHPPVLFTVPSVIADTPSHRAARDVLGESDSILDIGCGGGIAAFAIAESGNTVIGVDHQREMTEMFSNNAAQRQITSATYTGFWSDVEEDIPQADVVVCHHVVYNIPEISAFISSISAHARKRVVIELPTVHPLSNMNTLWKFFWNLDRPSEPTYENFAEAVRECGFTPHTEIWDEIDARTVDAQSAAAFMRIRLCLPKSRESEVAKQLETEPFTPRKMATVWWDTDK